MTSPQIYLFILAILTKCSQVFFFSQKWIKKSQILKDMQSTKKRQGNLQVEEKSRDIIPNAILLQNYKAILKHCVLTKE